jgi:hypothetical protein
MKCERMEYWILLKQSGELGTLRHALLQRHLARCASCRAFEETSLRIQKAVPQDVPGLSDFARNRIQQAGARAIERQHHARRPAGAAAPLWRPAAAFALLLIALAAGWLLLYRPDARTQTAQGEQKTTGAYAWDNGLDEELAELDEMLLIASQSLDNSDTSDIPTDTEDIAEELLLLEESS